MFVSIFSFHTKTYIPTEIRTNTVAVAKEKDNSLKMFRCIHCGESINQYQGSVQKIIPVLEPTDGPVFLDMCKNCGYRYAFQESKEHLPFCTVVLETSRGNAENRDFHWCHVCRRPILKYSPTYFYDLDKQKQVELPYKTTCERCGTTYLFREVV